MKILKRILGVLLIIFSASYLLFSEGKVSSFAGGGNPSTQSSYTITTAIDPVKDVPADDHLVNNLYPNPASTIITIAYSPDAIDYSGVLIVYSLDGRLVLSQNIQAGSIQELNISNLNMGMYTLNVIAKDRKPESYRFIKIE